MGKQELLKTRIRGDREYEKKQNGGSHDCGSRDDGYDRLQKSDSSNRDNERNGNKKRLPKRQKQPHRRQVRQSLKEKPGS